MRQTLLTVIVTAAVFLLSLAITLFVLKLFFGGGE